MGNVCSIEHVFACQDVSCSHVSKSVFRLDEQSHTVHCMDALVTRAHIARRLGISGERVRQLGRARDFPQPIGRLGATYVWRELDVARWAATRERPWPTR